MSVPVFPSHNSALSLWQSAMHNVLAQKPEQQNTGHKGIAATAAAPEMQATTAVLRHFQNTGSFTGATPPATLGAPSVTGNIPAQTAPTQTVTAAILAPGASGLSSAGPILITPEAQQQNATPVIMECAKLAAQIALYSVTDPAKAAVLRQELTDGTCDPLWAECLAVYDTWRITSQSQPYINYQNMNDFVIEQCFPDNASIAIIGDWGTGMNDALILLQQIAANFKPDVLLHLGDIYYSGLPDECAEHFTDLINKVWPDSGHKPLVFTLNGNHDRYAGSNTGYYKLIADLNSDANKPQPNSYFALRNNYWQFVALDTGLNDSNPLTEAGNVTKLAPQEIPWHLDKIKNASATVDRTVNASGARGTVLLSHHQLFSFTGVGKDSNGHQMAVNPNLVEAFSPALNQIDLWLWGHEHALCIFEPYSNGPGQPLPTGRCIGASAVPIYLAQAANPPADLVVPPGVAGPPQTIPGTDLGDNGTVFNYCYAMMKLAGPQLTLDYYQVDSTNSKPGNPPSLGGPLYSESITKLLAGN